MTSDPMPHSTSGLIARDRLVGTQQVTDAHLLAVAASRGGVLGTFDSGILDIVPPGVAPEEVVEILQTQGSA